MTLQIPQTGNPFPGNRSLRAHPTTYIVASGDTIYSIACLFGDVDPEAIAYVNNITSPNKQLTPGQTINIP
jgi:LysM repeat protein